MSVRIVCHTNLDLCNCESWPEMVPAVPSVGDYIESAHIWKYEGGDRVLELVVCSIIWRKAQSPGLYLSKDEWYPRVELNLSPKRWENMTKFYEWYGKICGRGVHAFI